MTRGIKNSTQKMIIPPHTASFSISCFLSPQCGNRASVYTCITVRYSSTVHPRQNHGHCTSRMKVCCCTEVQLSLAQRERERENNILIILCVVLILKRKNKIHSNNSISFKSGHFLFLFYTIICFV